MAAYQKEMTRFKISFKCSKDILSVIIFNMSNEMFSQLQNSASNRHKIITCNSQR